MKTILMLLLCRCWAGVLVEGLFSSMAASDEADAITESNEKNQEIADKANKIRTEQYNREFGFAERKQKFKENQTLFKNFEGLVNSSEASKSRLEKVWG